MKEKFIIWLVWKLPKRIIYWATVRLFAYASSIYTKADSDEIPYLDAVKVWRKSSQKEA